jgi:hypothetical protein
MINMVEYEVKSIKERVHQIYVGDKLVHLEEKKDKEGKFVESVGVVELSDEEVSKLKSVGYSVRKA